MGGTSILIRDRYDFEIFKIGFDKTANFASSVKVGDNTDVASATNVGAQRYRVSGNNSYVDVCMQTGASTYAWVNTVTQSW